MTENTTVKATRRGASVPCMHTPETMAPMSQFERRITRRPDNAPTVLLQGRVSPEVRAEYKAAADASGVSVAYYLEALAAKLLDEHGSMPLVESPRPQREELPIPAA